MSTTVEQLSEQVQRMFADLNTKLDELARAVSKPHTPDNKELWTAEQIAQYLGVSTRQVAERYAHDTTFPKPVRFPGGTTRRWVKSEILALPDRWRGKR